MKQFDLQTYLAHPEKKVVARNGKPVRILGTDRIDKYGGGSIIALIKDNGVEYALYFHTDGMYYAGGTKESSYDLFFADEEPELTEFEKHLKQLLDFSVTLGSPYEIDCIKTEAAELLDLARKQLAEEEYTSDPRKTLLYKLGKAEALKDLPRWSPNDIYPELNDVVIGSIGTDEYFFIHRGRIIHLESLEKLPGFKEE